MNRTSHLTATALAALLAGTPVAALAASGAGATGGETSGSSAGLSAPRTGGPGMATGSTSPGSATSSQNYVGSGSAQPGSAGTMGGSGPGPQVSQTTLQNAQQQLQQQGYYQNAQVDGIWGPQTRQAVQSFQQAKGLPVTGRLDQPTLGALGVNGQGG